MKEEVSLTETASSCFSYLVFSYFAPHFMLKSKFTYTKNRLYLFL